METRTASSVAVSEVLNVDNYLVWSVQVKTYLIARDLWDVVEATDECPKQEDDEAAFKDWRKKNAMALHVIQISCLQRICHVISLITSAKIAWETLKSICDIPKSDYFVPKESYVAWRNRMNTFLMNRDLWNIVETTTEPTPPDWSKKNALALYLIRESCGSDRFSLIEKISEAKTAWDEIEFNSGMQNNENSGFGFYVSFEEHIRERNWGAAIDFISSHPEALRARISILGSTALHIAIFAGHTNIVVALVNIMSDEDLNIKDARNFTVLGCCAIVGNIQMARCIIEKNRTLLSIGNGRNNLIPVVLALMYNPNGTEMVRYLYHETLKENSQGNSMPIINGINGATFITRAMYSKAIDLAANLLESYPALAFAPDCNGQSPVEVLAAVPFAYRSANRLVCWKPPIYNTRGSVWNPLKCLENDQKLALERFKGQLKEFLSHVSHVLKGYNFQQLEKAELIEAMIKAVKRGRVEFVAEILRTFPQLAYHSEEPTRQNIFMLAVLYRQEEVFHLLCRFPAKISMLVALDIDSNSILHIAAMLEPSAKTNKAPGAALLMLREVQWFKEVKRVVRVDHPFTLEQPNKNGQTPRELFIESHKELMKEGEKWMKEIANSCTVVGALIVTIMFAAAITVPGGNKQDSGLPMFLNVKMFMLFIISDVLSLLFASISLLTFLGFTSSRYTMEDFLESLPKKMMIGISTLIISITTMMITFCASLFIILEGKLSVIIPVICLASVPVALFAWMQMRLLIDVIKLTYVSGIVDREEKYGA